TEVALQPQLARQRCKGQQELSFASTFIVEIGAFAARYSIGLLTTRRGGPDFFLIASHPERVERTRIMPNTIQIHRVLRAAPEKVYRAFLNPEAMAKWLPPNGFTGKVHQMDAKVGGSYKMSFTNLTNGQSHSFGGKYVELVPNERIRYTDKFDDPNMPGEIQATVTLRSTPLGTELNVVQEGIP